MNKSSRYRIIKSVSKQFGLPRKCGFKQEVVMDRGGYGWRRLELAQCDTAPGLLMERWRLGVPTQRFYLFWIKTTFSFVDCSGTARFGWKNSEDYPGIGLAVNNFWIGL